MSIKGLGLCPICRKVQKVTATCERQECIEKYAGKIAANKSHRTRQYRNYHYNGLGEGPKKAEAYEPKHRHKSSITDAQQIKLNLAVDRKETLTFEYKQYTPGTPEWDEIVKKITPIERIRKEIGGVAVIAPTDTYTRGRHEDYNKMR